MADYFVWTTTRRLKPGSRREFEEAWVPTAVPEGMQRAYEFWSDDEEEVVGVSFWDSRESCERYRASDAEEQRREAMAPYIVDERSGYYQGRDLHIPGK
jgi:heme-degrading monooxygenase HmoA